MQGDRGLNIVSNTISNTYNSQARSKERESKQEAYVTGPPKINHVSMIQKSPILSSSPYHNLIAIYANKTKSFLLMQNLMGFVLQFTETQHYNHNSRY